MRAVSIPELARAVLHADGYRARAQQDAIEHILELALQRRLGFMCLADDVATVDLGNGFGLTCRVKQNGTAHRVTRHSGFDLVGHLFRQREFSERTFGPGHRTEMVLDHIRKELVEITAAPVDLTEWVDLILLALDGAWRAGHAPEAIAQGIDDKQGVNERRKWPDWRTQDPDKAIEHVRAEVDL